MRQKMNAQIHEKFIILEFKELFWWRAFPQIISPFNSYTLFEMRNMYLCATWNFKYHWFHEFIRIHIYIYIIHRENFNQVKCFQVVRSERHEKVTVKKHRSKLCIRYFCLVEFIFYDTHRESKKNQYEWNNRDTHLIWCLSLCWRHKKYIAWIRFCFLKKGVHPFECYSTKAHWNLVWN